MTHVYPLDDLSRVAEIRRAATTLGHYEGLDETLTGKLAIIASEIGTNLVKHAKGGEVFISTLSDRGGSAEAERDRAEAGVEILAIDRGPGMVDVARCLADGYSSAKTSGNGLGAIERLSHEFDIHSELSKGTVLVARVKASGSRRTGLGVVLKPIAGEEVSGDSWAFHKGSNGMALIVADGLGHGTMACAASAAAIAAFRRGDDFTPVAVLQRVHGALRATRGAAVAVAYLEKAESPLRYAGIGNISGVLAGAEKLQQMVSHNGTAGYHSPRLQEFSYAVPKDALLIMHSDGLHTNWKLNGLRQRDPSVIAGILYRDSSRNRDDVCVVVSRVGGEV